MPADLPPEAVEAMADTSHPRPLDLDEARAMLKAAIDTGTIAVVPPHEERVERVKAAMAKADATAHFDIGDTAHMVLAALGLDGEARDG